MDDQPNIVMILTDQERADLTEPGIPVETPHLDRLREEGMTFSRAYTPISICSSARASLLTGLTPHNHGMINNTHEADAIQPDLPSSHPTLGIALRNAGYRNTYVGKWHVGRKQTPEDFGFEYFGGSDKLHDDIDNEYRQYREVMDIQVKKSDLINPVTTGEFSNRVIAAGDPIPVEATRPYFIAERGISVLEALADTDEPFFHRIDFLGPHHPYIVPEPYASMYDPSTIDPWDSYLETFEGKPTVQQKYLDYRGVTDFSWDDWAEVVAKYWGFMSLIDAQIGRILEAIDELGLTSNIVVVHSSDHGNFVGHHRLFNKGPMMYEDGYRIPLHIRWPDRISPDTSSKFVHLHDLMPTLLDIGQADIPATIDGNSLMPTLFGEDQADQNYIISEYHGDEFGLYSQRMIRADRFKLIYNVPDINELYDLNNDPAELQNLHTHPHYTEVKQTLVRHLLEGMKTTKDPIYQWTEKTLLNYDNYR